MSYEGSRRWLCANGHLGECDCYDDAEKRPCRVCGAATVWQQEIDETNGFEDDADYLAQYPNLEIAVPAVVKVCDMGHAHIIEPERYKVPR